MHNVVRDNRTITENYSIGHDARSDAIPELGENFQLITKL